MGFQIVSFVPVSLAESTKNVTDNNLVAVKCWESQKPGMSHFMFLKKLEDTGQVEGKRRSAGPFLRWKMCIRWTVSENHVLKKWEQHILLKSVELIIATCHVVFWQMWVLLLLIRELLEIPQGESSQCFHCHDCRKWKGDVLRGC